MKPHWHPRSFALLPTGELTLCHSAITFGGQHKDFVFIEAHAQDELGAVWDVSHAASIDDLKCVKYPDELFANYWFDLPQRYYNRSTPYTAKSLILAIEQLRAKNSHYDLKDEEIKLWKVTNPDQQFGIKL